MSPLGWLGTALLVLALLAGLAGATDADDVRVRQRAHLRSECGR